VVPSSGQDRFKDEAVTVLIDFLGTVQNQSWDLPARNSPLLAELSIRREVD
jgi:hypothetical protein